MKSWQDKVVVITGAGSGMGRAYALELARRGSVLALSDVDPDGLAETDGLLPAGTRSITETYDVSDRAATDAFATRVRAELGGAHVVINNAGVEGSGAPAWATTEDAYERVMAINFGGVRHGTLAFLPQLVARGEGAIVNVSSIFGLAGAPSHTDYCASKFAVRGFSEALAAELVESPISVHVVHPGGINTNIARQSGSQDFASKYFGTQPEEIATVVADAVLKGRGRIVFGQGSRKTWLGARVLPLEWMARAVWRDMKGVISRKEYPAR